MIFFHDFLLERKAYSLSNICTYLCIQIKYTKYKIKGNFITHINKIENHSISL